MRLIFRSAERAKDGKYNFKVPKCFYLAWNTVASRSG